MNSFSEKIHLTLEAPTEEHPLSDQERILQALKDLGYPSVSMTLATLRGLYPLCRTQDWDITVTRQKNILCQIRSAYCRR